MSEPGWYHDPTDPTRLRLWNGTSWTDETRSAPSPTPAPAPPPAGTAFVPPSAAARPATLAFSPSSFSQQRTPRRGWWVVAGIATVLAVAAAATAVVITTRQAPPVEVTLLIATDVGADPFAEVIASVPPLAAVGPALPAGDQEPTVTEIAAATPGLYARSADTDACTIDLVANAVLADPAVATAFATAAGVTASELPAFLAGLTPVLLRYDTRVTSHRLAGPDPLASQAVLQRGTAVLIDTVGAPRVRCTGANPLTPPTLDGGEPTYVGMAWSGFTSSSLAAVVPAAQPLATIDVVDPTTGEAGRQILAAGGLVLQPDGLGLVTIGEPTDEVLTKLTALMGNPTVVEDTFIDGGLFLRVSWRSLTTVFQLPRGVAGEESTRFGFQGYLFGPWTTDEDGEPIWWVGLRGDDGSWEPTAWERSLATPEGIRIGGDANLANTTYPTTTLTRDLLPTDTAQGKNSICARRIPHEGIDPLPNIPINDQRISVDPNLRGLFFAPAQQGQVQGIGAGVLCLT